MSIAIEMSYRRLLELPQELSNARFLMQLFCLRVRVVVVLDNFGNT
jgi:hypothetical protein